MATVAVSCEEENDDNRFPKESFNVTLQPDATNGKDAFVEDYPFDNYSNRNWGDMVEFSAISWTSQGTPFVVRSLIDFNFDAIPSNATVDSAKLSLYSYSTPGHGAGHDPLTGSNECYLQRIISSWEEDTVTWNTQPDVTDLNRVLIMQSTTTMQDYEEIDVTDLVRDILNDRDNSFGFMLRLVNESGYRRMLFATSDVAEAHKRPKLEINYTVSD
jgi:hypothetical protein